MRRILQAGALAVLAAGIAAPAAPAQAADPVGQTAVTLASKAERQLDRAGVRIAAARGAARAGRRVELPVTGGRLVGAARLEHRGALRLLRGRRGPAVRISGLALTLSPSRSFATGRLGGEQRTLLRISVREETPFNPLTGEVAVRRARVTFARGVRNELSDRLGGARLPRSLGRLTSTAALAPPEPERVEPPVLARPPGAVDITAATLTWRARESFVNYLHAAGPNGGTSAGEGAVPGPAETIAPSTEARVYQWDLPFANGWRDAGSEVAGVYFDGLVNFRKWTDPFWIDLDARDAEVELNGHASRIIFAFSGRGNNADEAGRRAVAVDLLLDGVAPQAEPIPGGTRLTWERVPGVVPDGPTAWALADFYIPGDEWGWATISITVPAA